LKVVVFEKEIFQKPHIQSFLFSILDFTPTIKTVCCQIGYKICHANSKTNWVARTTSAPCLGVAQVAPSVETQLRSSEFAIRWCQVLGFAIPFYDGGSHGNKFFFSGKYSGFFGKARKKRVFSALQMLIFLAGRLQIRQD